MTDTFEELEEEQIADDEPDPVPVARAGPEDEEDELGCTVEGGVVRL